MICSCCEKKIKEDEKFYVIEEEFYCDDCVEVGIVVYYTVDGCDPCHEDDVDCYENIDVCVGRIERDIQEYKESINYHSKYDDDNSRRLVEFYRKSVERLEELKERAFEEEE